MKLRQKPSNPCIMQQEQFEGVWTDVFDYALCLGDTLTEFAEEQSTLDTVKNIVPIGQAFWKDFQDRYTGTSASYDPALTIEAGNEVTNRAALCAALKGQIDNYVQQSIKAKEHFTEDLSRAGVAIAATMSILAILALIASWGTAAPLLPAFFTAAFAAGNVAIMQGALGLSTAALAVWVQKVKDVDGAVLDDLGAREDILCVWYANLKDETDISDTKYAETLDMSGQSANAQALYQVIKPIIDQPLSYAAFLNAWKVQISYGGAGILLDLCTCEDTPIEVVAYDASYDDTVIEFKGVNGSNQTIWELTLPATGLNDVDAIAIRTTNTSGNRWTYLKAVSVLSGSFQVGSGGGQNMTPDTFDPDNDNFYYTAYALTFPAKLRITLEDAGY